MTTTFALGRQRAARFCVWLAVCAAAASAAVAQTSTSRITQAVDDSSRVTLKNNVSSVIYSATDQGAAAGSTEMSHLQLVLEASDEQKTALSQYLAEVQQKSSANYHKWLTPEQYGERFGASESDVATVTAWLEDQGFTDVSASKSRTTIGFSGTAETVQKAFGVSIHSFSRNGQTFYANTENPSIPSALSSVVSGVTHLSTLGAHSFLKSGTAGKFDTETKRLTPVSNDSSTSAQLHADLTYTSNSTNYLYLVPGDAATIYSTPNSFNANNSGSTSYTGSGVHIGIIGDALISTTPVTNYRSLFLGDSTAPTITGSTTSTSDAGEAYLDLEISGGLAPGATIHYYTGSDNSLATQISNALSDNTVDILSVSFGLCEQYMTTSENSAYAGYWQQAAAQGIAVTVSSGDSGSAGCDYTTDSNGNYVTTATGGLAVNGLASSVYNIAVGGTDFQLTQNNYTTYASTTSDTKNYYRSALSYIPEMVWNDSTQGNTTVSANSPWTSSTYLTQNIVAASGGKSSCSTNATTSSTTGSCTSGYGKPSWQRGTGVPSDNVRDLPDISLMSGVDYYSAWLVCTNDTSGGTTSNCSSSNGSFSFTGYGGTSAAAPAFAGILALVQQSQGGGRLGQAAANLYNIYNNSSSASSVFHDITVGNNSVPCTSGSTNCTKNSAGYYFESGYDTTTGYDLATGLGSVNATQLISAWSSGMGSATATVSASLSSSSIDSTNALTVTVNVSGSSNTPSGTVSVSGGGYTSSAVNLDSGTATIAIPANSLTVGTDTLTISYSGDGVYSSATTTASVTVTNSGTLTSTTTTLAASSTTPTYGTSVTLTATVAPTAATGTVHFYDSSTLIGSSSLSSGTATLSTSTLAVGSHTLTATYAGNSTYASSSSSSTTVTVSNSSSGSSGTFTLGATAVTVSQGSSGTSTITVTPSGGYTGTVGFTLSTSSTSLQNYGCYAISDATVSGTTAVTTTLTLYTKESDCSSTSAVKKNGVQKFSSAMKSVADNQPTSPLGGKTLPAGMAALAGVVLFGLRKRARWFGMLGCVMLLCGLGLAVGCGGSSSSSSSNEVAKGTYSVTLTGTDTATSSIAATTTFTLKVQ